MFPVYNGYKIQNFICDNEFSLNKDCFISFVIVVQKKLDQSLPLVVYTPRGGTEKSTWKGSYLPPAREWRRWVVCHPSEGAEPEC